MSDSSPNPFGTEIATVILGHRARGADDDVARVQRRLAELTSTADAQLDISPPLPTAAFGRRDALLPGYAAARSAVAALGFSPMVRSVGGHLAVYDEGALVVHLSAPLQDARLGIRSRFELAGAALVAGLRALGVDARLGPVPGEYCDGEFSVNDSGRAKLVGTGQRVTRGGYLFSAVVMVREIEPARTALTEAYALLELGFRPETVGCVADSVPGVSLAEVRDQVVAALGHVLSMTGAAGPKAPRTPPPEVS